jgi:hypothetical protein
MLSAIGHEQENGPMSLQAEIQSLKERVTALEWDRQRTARGRVNQRGAADYLGKSREYLRKLHLQGKGPRRGVDGSYSYDDLDAFAAAGISAGDDNSCA